MILVCDEALCRERAAWTAWFEELVDLEGDGSWSGRLSGELALRLAPDRALVGGELSGTVPRRCDLCLGVFLETVTVEVRDVCLIDGTLDVESAVFDDDAEAWRTAPEGRWDLTEVARQAVLLALPTRALCGPGCPARREPAPVTASDRGLDPRLAPLAGLFKPEVTDGGSEATGQQGARP